MAQPLPVLFIGGKTGRWKVRRITAVTGVPLPSVERVAVLEGSLTVPEGTPTWVLRGVAGHARYVERRENEALVAVQPPLSRPEATRAALLPIKKSEAWWDLPQDERRRIFEERSHHIELGLKYLPAVARRLHHCRDLGEPFDFLTWFEYAPEHEALFEELLVKLRATEEWNYVEREVDVRLIRDE
jgi:chlorite dismutase